MGKRSRAKRAEVKDLCRRLNYKENEFGELRYKMTKAEARRRFIWHTYIRRIAGHELVELIVTRAKHDIQAIEDQRFLERINRTIESMGATDAPV